MEEIKISKLENIFLLEVGTEKVPISDYQIKSSADGSTELNVTIKGNAMVFESLAKIEVLKR